MTARPEGPLMLRELEAILRDDLNLPTEQLPPDTSLEKAGLDSLAVVELSVLLEERYGITVSDAELNRTATLHHLDVLIQRKRYER
ncbi:acyl carrier protein [Streptomyces aurantiacus]|uniref:acyl carrier protein n=1 Tax=Streptomyces aurantiacus TaxID=47760 RepID=UPI0027914417|nr:acyl carrier protein [Streptomyces aurantiacus]MDQ0771583.1 acyl carrier protein [Streptomyces aurantiacus]